MEAANSVTVAPSSSNRRVNIPKPNNMFNVEYVSTLDFFRWWCVMLRPFIKLTDRETDVVASFLKHRWELAKTVPDDSILDKLLMGNDIIADVIKECNLSHTHFYVVMNSLKKKGAVQNGIFHRRLIPNTKEEDNGTFRLLIQFKEQS